MYILFQNDYPNYKENKQPTIDDFNQINKEIADINGYKFIKKFEYNGKPQAAIEKDYMLEYIYRNNDFIIKLSYWERRFIKGSNPLCYVTLVVLQIPYKIYYGKKSNNNKNLEKFVQQYLGK